MDIKYPEITVPLSKVNGNGYAIMAAVSEAIEKHLKSQGLSHGEIEKITDEYFEESTSDNYYKLVATAKAWVKTI